MQDVESTKVVLMKPAFVIRLLSSTLDYAPSYSAICQQIVPLDFRLLLLVKITACPVADGWVFQASKLSQQHF